MALPWLFIPGFLIDGPFCLAIWQLQSHDLIGARDLSHFPPNLVLGIISLLIPLFGLLFGALSGATALEWPLSGALSGFSLLLPHWIVMLMMRAAIAQLAAPALSKVRLCHFLNQALDRTALCRLKMHSSGSFSVVFGLIFGRIWRTQTLLGLFGGSIVGAASPFLTKFVTIEGRPLSGTLKLKLDLNPATGASSIILLPLSYL